MTPAIVFDLDGTLIDSAPDLRAALNIVLAESGAAPLDLATVTRFIGDGIPRLVQRAMAARAIDPGREAALVARMMAVYGAAPADLTRPYPGVMEALRSLRAEGYALGVCTNKALAPTRQILRALALAPFFDAVIGGDSLAAKKPDPAPLHAAFAPLGAPLLYVGDSEVDAQTARAAAIPFALFTEGYRKSPIADLPHRFAFDRFAALPPFARSLRDAAA